MTDMFMGAPMPARLGVLTSFHYYRRYDLGTIPERVPLILDSGAYSAFTAGAVVRLEDYAAWMDDLRDVRPWDFAFNLDVLGDVSASLRNWHELRERGHDTVPVVHYGVRPGDAIPAYLEAGARRIALGGVAGGVTPQSLAWTAEVFRWLRDTGNSGVLVHGLGVHMKSRLARFPWATTDASTFAGLIRWNFMHAFWDSPGHRFIGLSLNRNLRPAMTQRRAIAALGYRMSDLLPVDASTYHPRIGLGVASELRAIQEYGPRLPHGANGQADRYLAVVPSVAPDVVENLMAHLGHG